MKKSDQPKFKRLFISLFCVLILLTLVFSISAQTVETDQFTLLPLIIGEGAGESIPTRTPPPTVTPFISPTPTITPTPYETLTPQPESTPFPKITNVRNYIFGHSLILHATESDETTVPHWVHALAQDAGYSYAVDGQYGFLPQHANLPPNAQWGFQNVPGVWDPESGQTFADADFTTILLTAANFVQYQPATSPYDGDNPTNASPVSATLDIIDWVTAQEPGIEIYVYENWPDMAGFLSGEWPPSAAAFANYNAYTTGEFHDWWVDYHSELTTARPDETIIMIPVGPILAKLLTETELSQIPLLELYEDDAPHGEPTLYFLASLITYMSIYGEQPPADFPIPATVNQTVADNFEAVVDLIWADLETFGVVK